MRHPEAAARVAPLIEAGLVATTASLDAEALFRARNPAKYEQLWADRRVAYGHLPTDDEHWRAALESQRALSSVAVDTIAVPALGWQPIRHSALPDAEHPATSSTSVAHGATFRLWQPRSPSATPKISGVSNTSSTWCPYELVGTGDFASQTDEPSPFSSPPFWDKRGRPTNGRWGPRSGIAVSSSAQPVSLAKRHLMNWFVDANANPSVIASHSRDAGPGRSGRHPKALRAALGLTPGAQA
jgi:hypothetical protein